VFGIGGFELFLILLFAFLIFGPDKLPAIAKTLGRAIAKFREAQEGMSEQLKSTSFIDKESDNPFKNPLDVVENAAEQAKSAAKKVSEGGSTAASAAKKAATSASNTSTAATQHSGGFAERKAAYDAQRAARKKEEAARAESEVAANIASAEDPKADIAPKSAIDAVASGKSAGVAVAAMKAAKESQAPSEKSVPVSSEPTTQTEGGVE
jgi:sec-independent protein translocase protein TatB/colicin import membrane protein